MPAATYYTNLTKGTHIIKGKFHFREIFVILKDTKKQQEYLFPETRIEESSGLDLTFASKGESHV